MKSIAINHFPIIVFEGTEKLLFNPILKKRFKNRPEERVRLKWVEYLLHQTDRKKSRIGFETPVQLRQEKNTLRADLILFNKQMKPEILIECKAESVPLTPAVAEQAARYNSEIGAPFICLTNGVTDFWFEQKNGSVLAVDSPIAETTRFEEIEREPIWWANRGFCSPSSSDKLLSHVDQLCSYLWSDEIDWPFRYLDFSTSFLPFKLNQYYRVPVIGPDLKLAISFLGNPKTSSYLVAIYNQSGQNSGFLAIDLNELMLRNPKSGVLYANRDEQYFDAHKKLPLFEEKFNPSIIDNLPNFLISFFD